MTPATDPDPLQALQAAARREAFAAKLGMRCTEVGPGSCVVEMVVDAELLNLFGTAHGGAVFSLIDEAFQIACNSHGVMAVALNVSVTYIRPGRVGQRLVARAREVSLTSRTGTYEIRVENDAGKLVATAQALAYRKDEPLPFPEAGS